MMAGTTEHDQESVMGRPGGDGLAQDGADEVLGQNRSGRSLEGYSKVTTVTGSLPISKFAERSRWLMTNTIPIWTSR